jgi:hypothetical protein
MADKNIERALKGIEKSLASSNLKEDFSRDIQPIVLDTSFLIDLQDLTHSYKGPHARYARPDLFLDTLRMERKPLVIPCGVGREISKHRRVKVNDHVFELDASFANYLVEAENSGRTLLREFGVPCDPEQVRLDVYWTAKEACLGCPKKQEEGFSEEDKNFLHTVGLLQHCFDGADISRGAEKIHALSSDDHILCGARFLRDEMGYNRINPVQLRK